MADVFQVFNTSVNAGVGVNAPTVQLAVGANLWQITKVTIVIPAGHAGLTGIQLWYGGGPAIPWDSGWFSGDDDVIPLEPSGAFPAGVPWSVAMINNDIQQHTFQTRWEMIYAPNNSGAVAVTPMSTADIYAAAAA